MKRMILTGLLAIGAGATCLLAQAPPRPARQRRPRPNQRPSWKPCRPCRRLPAIRTKRSRPVKT